MDGQKDGSASNGNMADFANMPVVTYIEETTYPTISATEAIDPAGFPLLEQEELPVPTGSENAPPVSIIEEEQDMDDSSDAAAIASGEEIIRRLTGNAPGVTHTSETQPDFSIFSERQPSFSEPQAIDPTDGLFFATDTPTVPSDHHRLAAQTARIQTLLTQILPNTAGEVRELLANIRSFFSTTFSDHSPDELAPYINATFIEALEERLPPDDDPDAGRPMDAGERDGLVARGMGLLRELGITSQGPEMITWYRDRFREDYEFCPEGALYRRAWREAIADLERRLRNPNVVANLPYIRRRAEEPTSRGNFDQRGFMQETATVHPAEDPDHVKRIRRALGMKKDAYELEKGNWWNKAKHEVAKNKPAKKKPAKKKATRCSSGPRGSEPLGLAVGTLRFFR